MKFRAYGAELLGTFLLAGVVRLSLMAHLSLSTPVLAGLTLGLCVYYFGSVSGAHINPAVTIALASVKKIKPDEAVYYVVAQLLGAFLALVAVDALVQGTVTVNVSETLPVGIMEAVGAFILMTGVAAVVYNKVSNTSSGLTIGSSLLLGIVAASSLSNGVLNPAVALGIGSISFAYVLGPIVGAVAAVWV